MARMSSFSSASGRAETSHPPASILTFESARTTGTRQPPIHWLIEAIVRHRKMLLAMSLLPFVISFNGRWRIGLDSSIYRGLARAISLGRGYQFGEFGSHQIYPGLPVLLAGMMRVFGEHVYRPVAPLLLMLMMSLITMLLTYRLIARNFPQWMAVCVTCGMAINAWFLRLSQELLSDVPFLMGVMATLLGWDLLRTATVRKERMRAATLMIVGLCIAAVMRPTFWILVAALCCGWGLQILRGIGRGNWKLPVACLTILAAICAMFWALDPRSGGPFHPLSGGYESEVLETLSDSNSSQADSDVHAESLVSRVKREATLLLTFHLPAAFLGQQLPPAAGAVLSVILIGSTFFIVRQQPVWTMFILFTLIVTSMLSTEPRYYVMVMPFLLLSWLRLMQWLKSLWWGGWGDLVILAGLGMVGGLNIAKIAPFVLEQHSVPLYAGNAAFYDHYRQGKFAPVIHLADIVARDVPAGQKVVAPSAQVVAYLSDRDVLMERELLPPHKGVKRYPDYIQSLGITYATFPGKFYRDKEPMLARLIDRHVIQPTAPIASTDGMHLAKAAVVVPDGDWRETPIQLLVAAGPTTKKSKSASRPATSAPTTAKLRAAARKRAAEKAAAVRRRKKRAATTQSSTQATTSSHRKKKKHPSTTTAPATQPATGPTVRPTTQAAAP
jgi:hypothetical protein